jgi:hypothetical protein
MKMSKLSLGRLFAILVLLFTLASCAQGFKITTTIIPLAIGDSTVDLVLHETGIPGLTYLNIHDDENTCVKAALDMIKRYGGRVFELQHGNKRNITFQLDDVTYEFDPNRIYNDAGIAATLERFGPVNDDAIAAVRMFAEALLQQVKPEDLIVFITLHNNEPRDNYSINLFTSGGSYAGDAQGVLVSKKSDPNDLYFVTDAYLFNILSQYDRNVVLQDNENVADDGSLSVWSARHQIPYANIEVQEGHRRVQAQMIKLLHDIYISSNTTSLP